MKATDLMIGDWVLAEGKLTQVTDIDESEGINREWIGGVVCEDAGCISWEDIEPIPLTAEILEKNGFQIENSTVTFNENGVVVPICTIFWTNFKHEDIHCFLIPFFEGQLRIPSFKYIHEFQHLLKILCIKKEIKL